MRANLKLMKLTCVCLSMHQAVGLPHYSNL